jgi:hypothetical protein
VTAELARQIEQTSSRCTEATLRAFGIEDAIPQQGSGCLEHLKQAGFQLKPVMFVPSTMKKLKYFITYQIKSDNYLILTKGHAMAFVDGHLIDTELKGFDNRVIEFCWVVLPAQKELYERVPTN